VLVLTFPEGETSSARPGTSPNVNARLSLHGPILTVFQVWIHHRTAPETAIDGVTLQTPVPVPQFASAAVYHCLIGVPLSSFTHSQYQLALLTAFHSYVGVPVVTEPAGEIKVVSAGGEPGVRATTSNAREVHTFSSSLGSPLLRIAASST